MFPFKIPRRCFIGFKIGNKLGQLKLLTFFSFLETPVWFRQCALDRYHTLCISYFCLSFWRLGIILSATMFVNLQAVIVASINDIFPTPFTLLQPHIITPYHHTLTSMLRCQGLCIHSQSPGQVRGKHAGPGDPKKLISVSSDRRICSQCASGFFSCSLLNFNLTVLCWRARTEFFFS